MNINLISVGTRMPDWVSQGVQEYQKRLPADFAMNLIEVPMARRSKNLNVEQMMDQEADSLLAKVGSRDYLVALDVQGKALSTEKMASRVSDIRDNGFHLSLLVGGPDGLSPRCLQQASEKWSLSALTLPHPLVRILIAEQIYRVWSVINGHPYHRA
ncbi:23S rRNA (pseudouridine(1915)-N(3))-methyltransferase RlmH [Pseudohongiella sp. SYSU M77423]|uniref:23S rRNA (pseudouridine(1915)-N(3))-methyltransferase RlmH n=1 Tax=Pseudohongiella sp. SYSU M77423 TaxID=3042312 RepID=UPI000C518A89|nr:23S rRNA (pseudouridine(1915)-N(3))-methyltransferase RlmH [Pseudohongiella sp. SYSU M77423]MAY56661.1 23S rRNA (pseudouridine(1915)-N(3))-methyltransferase RlmH [Gammaproteobacteria bacterium]MBJ55214.1 23S rRNA (pseudouridine(1915)-N(3))-methyltransferase RlmH [Gammaproteobacteria bacterium]MDH7944486.1 23S rRNA (pseudouridine(1915)-N(3))-methyltransferase RlmH [Pseudohongiella sp. SYSU M77423]HBN13481.1 23S rRNA (pseudouridine(1915)-N(3))-methyltransferase RlmH [Pseudohongiella sp.]